jgi:arabinose-5-phosphate isomerase
MKTYKLQGSIENLLQFQLFFPTSSFYTAAMAQPKTKAPDVNDDSLLATGRRVLAAESRALSVLSSQLDGPFIKAIAALTKCKGRIVVTGMGKSGHIARKIAATLASTGTPALFVHPGEASHGDLGMIVQDDVVIALSNSGETAELTDLVAYTRRFSITLIAMTRGEQSALSSAADITLLLPAEPETCPMGLAPTTSTTMMLALGDALAVATLESKGFTAEDFHNFHPGGKLGKILLRVNELMHTGDQLPVVNQNANMADVLVTITQKSFGCAAIVDDTGNLTGIITDGDLRRNMHNDLLQKTAASVMTKNPQTVTPQTLAAEALKLLNDKKRNQLLVVENGKPVGVLHIHDLLRAGIA